MAREIRWTEEDLEAIAAVRYHLARTPGNLRSVSMTDVLRFCVHRTRRAVDAIDRRRQRRANEGGKNGDQ